METAPQTSLLRKILRLVGKIVPFGLVLLVIVFVIFPLNKKIAAQKEAMEKQQATQIKVEKVPVNVVTMEMQPGMVSETISLPGVTEPWISLEVVAEVKGKIISKKVTEGTRVKKGDILAVIDKRDYQHSYNSALASYETAQTTLKRFRALSKKQFVTQSQLDDAEARVKTTRAAVETAELNLDRCTIRSPMKGIVDRVHIEPGNFLDTGDPVAFILQIHRLKVAVGIPESDVDAVRRLKTFDMTFDALGGRTLTGKRHYLYKTADAMARLYTLEIALENPSHDILPDMFARVTIVKQEDPQGLAVPIYSLVTQNKQTGVFVARQDQAAFRPVTIGFQDGWRTYIPDGLFPGDQVVVVGQRIIEHGQPVRVTRQVSAMEELTQ